jgi:hypothetical protein
VYAAAAQLGMRIGTDLAVTGFHGSVVGMLLTPALTTIAIPIVPIAERLTARPGRDPRTHRRAGRAGRAGARPRCER